MDASQQTKITQL